MRQRLRLAPAQTKLAKDCRRRRPPRRDPVTGAGQNADRNAQHNLAPIVPQMKAGQIVRAHQPDELNTGIKRLNARQRLGRKPRANPRLNICNLNPRMIHHLPRPRHPHRQGRRSACFQRVPRRDQPPDLIQPEPLHRLTCDMCMPFVGRVKRPTQQTDHLTGTSNRQSCAFHDVCMTGQGRAVKRGKSWGVLGCVVRNFDAIFGWSSQKGFPA